MYDETKQKDNADVEESGDAFSLKMSCSFKNAKAKDEQLLNKHELLIGINRYRQIEPRKQLWLNVLCADNDIILVLFDCCAAMNSAIDELSVQMCNVRRIKYSLNQKSEGEFFSDASIVIAIVMHRL